MNNQPLISVIIPCYNVGKYIPDSIGSVLQQTYNNVECIVIDDGSTDDTEQIVKNISKTDNRVQYYRKENGGPSSARNYGIGKANGDLIQFLDSDDWLNTDKFNYQVDYINKHQIKDDKFVLYSDFKIVWYGNNNEIIQQATHEFEPLDQETLKKRIIGRQFGLDTPTPLSVCSTLFSKSILQEYKFNENMFGYEDLTFFIHLLYGDTKFYYTPVIGFYYRQRNDSISKDKSVSRVGYLQFLESIYIKRKDDLVYCPNMHTVIQHFFGQRDRDMFSRALGLVKNSNIPVYTKPGKNIRKSIVLLEKINLYYTYLMLHHFRKKLFINMKKLLGGSVRFIKRVPMTLLLKIGCRLHYLEKTIAARTLPKFANKQKNLRISLPRRIDNPKNIYIGDNVSIGPGSLLKTVVQYPGNSKQAEEMGIDIQKFTPTLKIGNRVSATASLQISALNKIVIEDDVMFASNIFICDGLHGYENTDVPYKYQPMFKIEPITIGRGCWIGQNVVIMPGVTIGEMSIIGANSVVTKDIPSRSIAVGAPARVVKTWNKSEKKWSSPA